MRKQPTTPQQLAILKRLQQEPMAYAVGVSGRQLRKMDAPRNSDGVTYDVQAVVRWWIEQQAEQADPLMAGGSSPNLERWRGLRADREQIELKRLNDSLVDKDVIRDFLGRMASHIRHAGEQIQREFGRDAYNILGEALAEFEKDVIAYFNKETPSTT